MKRLIAITSTALVLVLAIGGCNTSGCLDNGTSIPLAGFYSSIEQTPIALDSIEIGGVGAPNDSLLVKCGDEAKSVYLPLRSDHSSSAFYIRYMQEGLSEYPEIFDTLTIEYTSTPYFASEECGAVFNYTITRLSHTTHFVDSIVILDSLITNVEAQRLKIYFRV